MIEKEEYKVLQQHEVNNRIVFDKIIRLADDVIYELNVTETEKGKLIHLYNEDNNYRKLVLVFMDDKGGNNHIRISDAPLPTVRNLIVYWASNEPPPTIFFERQGVMIGEKAREYNQQIKEWEHEIFVYDNIKNTFTNRDGKKITDFKCLFKII
jgi:hypothetical protein